MASDRNDAQALERFDALLQQHVGYALSNVARTLALGLTAGKIAYAPVAGKVGRYVKQLTRMSAALAMVSDVVMLMLGGELKRRERISARLGDVLSHLYLASAVVKYYQEQGQLQEDWPQAEWLCSIICTKCKPTWWQRCTILPLRPVGVLLKWCVFPYGLSYRGPSDRFRPSTCEHRTKTFIFSR